MSALDEFVSTIVARLEERLHAEHDKGRLIAPYSDPRAIAKTIEEAFYGSVEPEEGHAREFSIYLLEHFEDSTGLRWDEVRKVRFLDPIPLTGSNLAKLAGATDPRHSHIAVAPVDDELRIVGILRTGSAHHRMLTGQHGSASGLPAWLSEALNIRAEGPGVLNVVHDGYRLAEFSRGTIRESKERVLDDGRIAEVLREWAQPPLTWTEYQTLLLNVLRGLIRKRSGGTLLLSQSWEGVSFRFKIAESRIIRDAFDISPGGRRTAAFRDTIRVLADLASIDGATVLTPDLQLIGFGGKIDARPPEGEKVEVRLAGNPECENPFEALGTRHKSAAIFCHMNPGAVVLVVSQDGTVSALHRDRGKPVLVWRPIALERWW